MTVAEWISVGCWLVGAIGWAAATVMQIRSRRRLDQSMNRIMRQYSGVWSAADVTAEMQGDHRLDLVTFTPRIALSTNDLALLLYMSDLKSDEPITVPSVVDAALGALRRNAYLPIANPVGPADPERADMMARAAVKFFHDVQEGDDT